MGEWLRVQPTPIKILITLGVMAIAPLLAALFFVLALPFFFYMLITDTD